MAIRTSRQKGNSLVLVLALIVVVGATGTVGWIVYQRNRTQSTGAVSNSEQPPKQQKPPTSKPTKPVAYLDIKEWGVKVPLPKGIEDAYYTVEGSSVGVDGLPNTAWIGLTSLDGSGCNVREKGPSPTADPIGSVIRVTPADTDPVTGEFYTKQNPGGVIVDGYYYVYLPWKNKNCAPADKLQAIDVGLTNATKGLDRATAATNN